MINEQLLSYVKQARQGGKSDNQIRQELLSSGWQGNDIEETLKIKLPIKSLKYSVLILAVLSIAVVGYFASAYYLTLWPFEVSAPVSTFTPRPSSAIKTDDSSNLKTYQNNDYKYGLQYLADWTIQESAQIVWIRDSSQRALLKVKDLARKNMDLV